MGSGGCSWIRCLGAKKGAGGWDWCTQWAGSKRRGAAGVQQSHQSRPGRGRAAAATPARAPAGRRRCRWARCMCPPRRKRGTWCAARPTQSGPRRPAVRRAVQQSCTHRVIWADCRRRPSWRRRRLQRRPRPRRRLLLPPRRPGCRRLLLPRRGVRPRQATAVPGPRRGGSAGRRPACSTHLLWGFLEGSCVAALRSGCFFLADIMATVRRRYKMRTMQDARSGGAEALRPVGHCRLQEGGLGGALTWGGG
jgi:hypothetical protein